MKSVTWQELDRRLTLSGGLLSLSHTSLGGGGGVEVGSYDGFSELSRSPDSKRGELFSLVPVHFNPFGTSLINKSLII